MTLFNLNTLINNLISRIKGKLKYASINTQSIENNQKTKFPQAQVFIAHTKRNFVG